MSPLQRIQLFYSPKITVGKENGPPPTLSQPQRGLGVWTGDTKTDR